MPSTDNWLPTPNVWHWQPRAKRPARAREGTAGRLMNPARSTCPRTSTLRISHFPGPHTRRYPHPAACEPLRGFGSSPIAPTRRSRQGGAPHRTNDLDGDKRRRTLGGAETALLTTEGSLLDDDERAFQEQVLSGPPPLGPGATPLDRLIAYGRARVGFMLQHREIARAALDGSQPIPAGSERALSRVHIRMLLGQIHLGTADLNVLASELTAALEGPLLLYLSASDLTEASYQLEERIAQGWQDLVQRVCRA
jgi:hypothetical protein